MAGIDWSIVGTVSGMGYLMTFIVIGIVAIVVWAIGLIIMKSTRAEVAKDAVKNDKK